MKDFFEPKEFIAYHYTDLNALTCILGKNDIRLRATNCLYLNDSQEIKEGIAAVNRIANISLQEGSFRGYYITSFSKSSDELSMWGMYAANGNGCAIGLDINEVEKYYGIMIQCAYGEKEIDDFLRSAMHLSKMGYITHFPSGPGDKGWSKKSELTEDLANYFYISTCLGAKNEAFKNENEVRCVTHGDKYEVKFKTKNGIIVPYIDITDIPKSALKTILIGPTNNSDLAMQSVIHFLRINGYDLDKVKVVNSKIPYRG